MLQLNVAAFINDDLKMTVLSLCVDELSFFAKTYKREYSTKQAHILLNNVAILSHFMSSIYFIQIFFHNV